MSLVQKNSLRGVISSIYKILTHDETLLRLLHYPSSDDRKGTPDPLDISYPDIVGSDVHWDIVEESIKTFNKPSNIEETVINRIYLYAGRRRSTFGSYLQASQELRIDIFVNEKFDGDLRFPWLIDRVNELIALEHIDGIYGKLDFAGGDPRQAPIGYSLYESVYVYTTNKK